MKKLLLTAALVAAMGIPASAEYVVPYGYSFGNDDSFTYFTLDPEAKTVSIAAAKEGLEGDLIIPETVEAEGVSFWSEEHQMILTISGTFNVVQIHERAFDCQTKISSVTIPAGVQVVGPGAFEGCTGLKSITFEASDTPIELYQQATSRAWYDDAGKLENVTVNRSVVCSDYADIKDFNSGGAQWNLYLPNTFFNNNFANCKNVTIGADVKELGAGLFNGLSGAERVDIANWGTWYNDVKLGDTYSNPYRWGNSEIYVAGMRFTTVELPEGTTEIPDFKLTGLNFSGEVMLPSTLKRIGAYAFAGQKDMYYVSMPEGLEAIGEHAFDGCETLEFDALPSTLTSIGDYAFQNCETLTSVTLPEGLKELGEGAFREAKNLEKAVLFSNVTELKGHTFEGCLKLEKVYLPKQLRTIGKKCFRSNWALNDITFPESLEEIGKAAFCTGWLMDDDNDKDYYQDGVSQTGLEKLNLVNVRKIGEYSFSGCSFIRADLGSSLEEIGEGAFSGCNHLADVKFPETVKSIRTYAFTLESLLTRVKLPASLTTLETNAFRCGIGELTVPDGITVLKSGACGNAAILNLGSGIKTIEENAIGSAGLRLIRIHAQTPPSVAAAFPFTSAEYDNITLVVNNGCKDAYSRSPRWRSFNIVEESQCEVTVHVSGQSPIAEEIRLQSGIMPSRVSKLTVTGTLTDADFRLIRENMISLYSLNLAGITNTTLPEGAFENMSLLTEVVLPTGLTAISDRAFKGCTLVDTDIIPAGVTAIGSEAFSGCSLLDIDELPDVLETIGSYAFADAISLKALTAGSSLRQIEREAFRGCTLLEFADLSASALTAIEDQTFRGCTGLQTILLPEALETIGCYAFAGTALEAVELPSSVKTIAEGAFGLTKLRAASVPENVELIPGGVFAFCPRLMSVNLPSTLRSVSANIFSGSMRLSALSCSAIDAPAAETGAFDGIRAKKCSLTVPTVSFRSYLNAPQWGIFSDLYNRIAVEIPAEDVEVSAIPEEEFEELVEEVELEEELEAPVPEEEPETPAQVRRQARRAAQSSLLSGAHFARLFDGATLGSSDDSKGTRIFINLKPGAVLRGVLYNGKDVMSEMVDNSLLLRGANGTLKIVTENSSVDLIEGAAEADAPCTVYNMAGQVVYEGMRSAAADVLAAGVYVVKTAGSTEKIVIR